MIYYKILVKKHWMGIVKMDYDIFISYKHLDEHGAITKDYEMAKHLFSILTNLGYNVFFSSMSLETLGSSRYKSDIDAALDTTKVMIVVLSKVEYAHSQWVQYEWDSFYNDYLSGTRPNANLFTLTLDINIHDLPRTLRNVQNFSYSNDLNDLCNFIKHALPKNINNNVDSLINQEETKIKIKILSGREVTSTDIMQAVELDKLVYDDVYCVDSKLCEEWVKANPDIYVMAKDEIENKIIAYVNISPVTDECYERLKKGDFIDTGITSDMILSYDMPFPYSVYFSSIVIHPSFQNTEVFMELFNAVIDKFIYLGHHEVYIRRMIADAVTKNGEKFCKLFGMVKVKGSNHNSTLYEICMIPPKFRILSKKTKQLHDYYQAKYEEEPFLFDEN